MFSPEDILARLRQQPFVPLRIVSSSGQTIDVTHPDLVLVGRRFLEIGTPSNENPATFDNVLRFSIMHVTALQDLPAPVPVSNNGG